MTHLKMNMMNLFRNPNTLLQCLSLVVTLCVANSLQAQVVRPQDTEKEAKPYFALQALSVGSVKAMGPEIAMGGPVVVHGTSTFGHSNAMGFLLGKEFRQEPDEEKRKQNEQEEIRFTRLEFEYWTGAVKQTGMQVGLANLSLNDKLSAQALLINGLIRIGSTENTRWWAGAGLGWGSIEHPSHLGAVQGCQCLGPAKASGSTWRIKLVAERQLSEDSALYLHVGHLQLPGVANAGMPSTQYGKVGLTDIGFGFRQRF